MAIMGALGYRKRTGFLAGLTVAKISEFSLIFVAMGISLGHLEDDALGLVTMVGLVTIAASTYMITWSHQLYALFEPALGVFERRNTPREASKAEMHADLSDQIILFGLGRFGTAIGLRLKARGVKVLGLDFNPMAVRRWQELGLQARFGDATDPEFVRELPLQHTAWIVLTVPQQAIGLSHDDTRGTLLQLLRTAGFGGRMAVTSHTPHETESLLASGANLVLEPFQDAADQAADLLCGGALRDRTSFPNLDNEGA